MADKKTLKITRHLIPELDTILDSKILESASIYYTGKDIFDKTNLILGRKKIYKNTTSSTIDTKLINNSTSASNAL